MLEKSWFDIAMEHQDESNYSQALVAIKKYFELNPEEKSGKLLEASIYVDLHNYDLALKILTNIKLVPTDDKEYFELYYSMQGHINKGKGNYNEAIKWYDKLIESIPNETRGYIFKGACLASTGEYEQAKIEHLKATTLEGDPEEAFYNLALIHRAEMKHEEAKIFCEKSLEIEPDDESVNHCYEDIIEAIKLQNKQ